MWLSFSFLSQAFKYVPIGTAYAIFTGIGAVGITIVGILWFKEPATIQRMACILLILIGIIGPKVLSQE